MSTRNKLIPIACLGLIWPSWTTLGQPAPGQPAQLDRFEKSELHMGTRFTLVLYATQIETANQAFQAAFQRIAELDQRLTNYGTESELNRLCRQSSPPTPQAAPRSIAVSEDLWRVLRRAQQVSLATNGAFDVTVGPLTRLWRRARRRQEMPAPAALQQALQAVGFQHVVMREEDRTVELRRPNMKLDLGGIAKGFACDEALQVLSQHGIHAALVNAGGDIVAAAPPPDQRGWSVALAPMGLPAAKPGHFLTLAHAALATSGDAWQFVEIDGQRYSHILDPRTGVGLIQRRQATVLAADGMTADSLASALVVMGPETGIKLIESWGHAEGLLTEMIDDVAVEHATGDMQRRLRAAKTAVH